MIFPHEGLKKQAKRSAKGKTYFGLISWIQFECFENKNQNRFVHWILVNQLISFFWLTMSKIEKMYKPSKAHEQDFWHVFVIKVCFGNSPRCCQTCTVFICSLAGAIPKIIPIYIGLKKIVKTYHLNIYFTPFKSNLPWLKSWFQKKLWSRDFTVPLQVFFFLCRSQENNLTVV